MIPNVVLLIKQYSLQVNPGMEIVDTYYYDDIGLCHRITHYYCYNWRIPGIINSHIFKVHNGRFITRDIHISKNYI